MRSDTLVSTSAKLIGGTTLVFAGWALVHPQSLGSAMGVDEQHARWLGLRDTVSAGLLLTRGEALSFAVRAAADVSDAMTVGRDRPKIVAGAAVFAIWSAAAAVVAFRRDDGLTPGQV